MRRLLVAAALALLVVAGGLIGYARAQVEPLKHHACYSVNTTATMRSWFYLPDGNDNCGSGYAKIDWIDD